MLKTNGFTLVELAIVIVIIGLLVGGVLQGQELIEQARNRKLYSTIEQLKAATITFKGKYSQYPGDLNRAEVYWGSATACPAGTGTGTNGKQTCNGNGDGNISNWNIDGAQNHEFFHYWQHLGNADLIKGTFSGSTTTATLHISGVNAMPGPHEGSLIGILNSQIVNQVQTASGGFAGVIGQFYVYGAATVSGHPWNAAITPVNAMTIDTKMDDGIPGTGKYTVLAQGSTYTPNCVTGTAPTTATFNVQLNSKECSFVIVMDY